MTSSIKPADSAVDSRHESSGPGRIREINRAAVLSYIRLNGPHARATIGRALGLSGAAISAVVSELLKDGLLRETESEPVSRRMGRPRTLLELEPAAAYALGLVLRPGAGRLQVEAAWVNFLGEIQVLPAMTVDDPSAIAAVVEGVVNALRRLKQTVPDRRKISRLVVGIPGVVDDQRVHIAPRLMSIVGENFIRALQERIDCPLSFRNDVNLATLAELKHQSRLTALRFAYLYIAAGVGAGYAVNGKIRIGHGWTGEVGQLRITRGRGRRDSFEDLLGIDSKLADQMEALGLPRRGLDELADALDARNRRATSVANRYAESLCDLIQVLNATLDLDEVIVDFPSQKLFDRLLPRVLTSMADSPLKVSIKKPSIGLTASVRGAALEALELSFATIQARKPRDSIGPPVTPRDTNHG